MSKLKKQLQEEKARLETILKTTEERLVNMPADCRPKRTFVPYSADT